jgi:hypothetical protein
VIDRGYVAIADDRIVSVGPMAACPPAEVAQIIDASGHAVLPGFVNAHVHTFDILLRGGLAEDRGLYDWLCNIVLPGTQAYSNDDVRTAARLFCLEAVRAGATTIVDNVEAKFDRWERYAELITSAYAECGLRGVYSQMFYDYTPPDIEALFKTIAARAPDVDHDLGVYALDDAPGRRRAVLARGVARRQGASRAVRRARRLASGRVSRRSRSARHDQHRISRRHRLPGAGHFGGALRAADR